jgi:hypothetical protein
MSEFERSYSHVLLYPPQPAAMLDFAGRQANFTSKMYGFYLEDNRATLEGGAPVSESFLVWHRVREYDSEKGCARYRGGKNEHRFTPTQVVACRYWYELTDGYWGQFNLTQIPHVSSKQILPQDLKHLVSMQNFVGMIEYLMSWTWFTVPGIVQTLRPEISYRIVAASHR